MESPINFYSKTKFDLQNKKKHAEWLKTVVASEGKELEGIDFIFCSDEDLLFMNQRYLDHDTFTDIITFDYSEDEGLSAEIYISIDRVKDNAKTFKEKFENELKRVLVHGVLHCCGYGDSTEESKAEMRVLENEKIKMFHVEQK